MEPQIERIRKIRFENLPVLGKVVEFFRKEDSTMQECLRMECEVNAEEIQDLVFRLEEFLKPYLWMFGRSEPQGHAMTYVMGRMEPLDRRTIEPIANRHDMERRPLQRFVGAGLWKDRPILNQLNEQVAKEIGSRDGVFVLDSSGFPKCGTESVGVQRQYCGRLGKLENCQVGQFLAYASSKGETLVDFRLYLPESWASDRERRAKVHIPPEVEFRKGWELALEMLQKRSQTLPHSWVLGDDEYGRVTALRDRLDENGERYLLEVPCDTVVGVGRDDGRSMRVDRIADGIPKRNRERIRIRDGEKGPVEVHAVKMRANTFRDKKKYYVRETLLVIWRSDGERRYLLSNACGVSVKKMAKVYGCRHYVEEALRTAKGDAGLAEYEVRSWVGWHHHITLSLLAMYFLVREKNRFKKNPCADRPTGPMGDWTNDLFENADRYRHRVHRATGNPTATAQSGNANSALAQETSQGSTAKQADNAVELKECGDVSQSN